MEDASKLNMLETKEEPLRNKCLAGRLLKEEQHKELGAPSTLQGHPSIRSGLVSRWKHIRPFVCDEACAIH